MKMTLPKRATVNESFQLIKFCSELERAREEVQLDTTQTEMFGPFGLTLLASSIALRTDSGFATTVDIEGSTETGEFLREIGFDRFARGEETGLGSLEVRQLSALDALYTESVARLLVAGVEGFDSAASYPIQLCLNELLQNVFEWSESPVGCFVLCRWYRKTRSVRLAVVDRGVGIPAVLRRSQIAGLHRSDDAAVIRAAVTTPKLTSRANRVGGLGLKTIRETVCERGGRLTVVSLGAKVRWADDRVSSYRSPPLRGTAIEVDFRPEQAASSKEPSLELF